MDSGYEFKASVYFEVAQPDDGIRISQLFSYYQHETLKFLQEVYRVQVIGPVTGQYCANESLFVMNADVECRLAVLMRILRRSDVFSKKLLFASFMPDIDEYTLPVHLVRLTHLPPECVVEWKRHNSFRVGAKRLWRRICCFF